MPTTDKLQYLVHKISNTYFNKTRAKSYPMEKYNNIKEEYLNILTESPELPSMPDIGEPDVILADGEQWKSDIELLRKLLPGVPQ